MKNLLFLLVMLTFLVACNDDDDNDKTPRNKYGQFLVEKIVYSRSSGHYSVFEFVYDSQNVLTKIIAPDDEACGLERNGSKLTVTYWDDAKGVVGVVYGILNENECLVSMQNEEYMCTFVYDASNRLISMNSDSEQYVWKENNVQSIKTGNLGGFVFGYTEYPNNININFIYAFDEICKRGFLGGDDYLGRPNQNLIKSYTSERWGDTYEFEYEFDGEKVTVVREYYVRDGERELDCTYRLYYK